VTAAEVPAPRARPGLRLALRWAAALAALGALLAWADPRRIGGALAGADAALLAALVPVAALWLLLGAANLRLLLGPAAPPPRGFVGVYLVGTLASALLPGQLGDAVVVPLLRRHGVPLSRSGAAYLADKAVSFCWMVVVATTGAALFLTGVGTAAAVAVAVGAVLVAATAGLAFLRMPLGGGRLATRLRRVRERLAGELAFLVARPAWLARNLAITVARWVLVTVLYGLAFAACGERLPVAAAATLPILASLVGYLPVSVGGLGTMEWAAVGLFGLVGVAPPPVVAAYLLLRGVLLAVAGLGALALLGRALGRRG
jgi:hypothetical protein